MVNVHLSPLFVSKPCSWENIIDTVATLSCRRTHYAEDASSRIVIVLVVAVRNFRTFRTRKELEDLDVGMRVSEVKETPH